MTLLLLGAAQALRGISDFWTSFFNSITQGYYDVNLGDFLSDSKYPGNRLVSLTDLNNDKKTDLVVVDDTHSVIWVYLYDDQSASFYLSSQTFLTRNCTAISVSFLDIAGDGSL